MAIDSFPVLYFNMSGEMIYIIDQRLQSQKIGMAKSQRVLNDIILSVFNPKLIQEVFKPHNAITLFVLKTIFEKLAHSSIMRLNDSSMNKLFDLMIMVIKYQLFACPKPSDIITITDNHLISIIELIQQYKNDGPQKNTDDDKSSSNCSSLMDNTLEIVNVVRSQFLFHYQSYDLIQFQHVRYNLLNFLKDIRTRVSIFLREGTQTNDGTFVIPFDHVQVECECQIPGVIRYFRGSYNEILRTEHFEIGGRFSINENRTILGMNIYKKENEIRQKTDQMKQQHEDGIRNQKEIDLLAKLICKTPNENDQHDHHQELKFDFLNSDKQQKDKSFITNKNDQSIQVIESTDNEQLIQIIQDLNEVSLSKSLDQQDSVSGQNWNDEIDLLELMDS